MAIELIPDEMRNALKSRIGVGRALSGDITLISLTPIGSGKYGFVCPGW